MGIAKEIGYVGDSQLGVAQQLPCDFITSLCQECGESCSLGTQPAVERSRVHREDPSHLLQIDAVRSRAGNELSAQYSENLAREESSACLVHVLKLFQGFRVCSGVSASYWADQIVRGKDDRSLFGAEQQFGMEMPAVRPYVARCFADKANFACLPIRSGKLSQDILANG